MDVFRGIIIGIVSFFLAMTITAFTIGPDCPWVIPILLWYVIAGLMTLATNPKGK